MKDQRVLWVDDEIDMLQAHIAFLESKGISVTPCSSGDDAVERVSKEDFDLVLLDEMMPGKDGLATLVEIKDLRPHLPVVMVTKSEEETLMEDAIGQKIDDYLTKPVNPSQVLMAIKKLVQRKSIVAGKLGQRYIADINRINTLLTEDGNWKNWAQAYRVLCEWDMELDRYSDEGLTEIHKGTRKEWNGRFTRYYEQNYEKWLAGGPNHRPPLSVDIVDRTVAPRLKAGEQVVFIVIDCMRMDLWLKIEPLMADLFHVEHEYFFSILPSATPFARNAIFSGLFPVEIARLYPDDWKAYPDDEVSRNRREGELLERQLAVKGAQPRNGIKYIKVLNEQEAGDLVARTENFLGSQIVALVINFVDVLTHGRSNNVLLKEMVPDEAAFRALTQTWFEHSSLYETLKMLARKKVTVIITTDHGSTLCSRGTIAHGKRDTSSNLRYKYGDNLNCNPKEALLIKNPERFRLPVFSLATTYIIAREDFYFVYPNRYNEYLKQFQNSFQHGGISMDEIILPIAIMKPKG
ncbi:MAG: bifunctional response regulator/alkaline phosphatase family protein [candidate division Zixibacteria bacterium]|nr:bifunctional response regulator/alkaline phosphatase family protein [candidate division Zixibacteria bacterium]